jgi:hypothetical protein
MAFGVTTTGIGLRFTNMNETVESVIADITRSCKEFDRDRVSA